MRPSEYVGACADCHSEDLAVAMSTMGEGVLGMNVECLDCGAKWKDFVENDEF